MGEHIESEDFDHYLKAVKEGLKDEDVILIRELFAECASDPAGSPNVEEEA
jgi:hypothetical protein